MFNALPTAVIGIYQAVARATQSASNIANASLTGKNVDEDLIKISVAKTEVAANATVIKAQQKMDKALLDIMA